MIRTGLARRVQDASDRRIVLIEATKRGRSLHAGFADVRVSMMRDIIGRMPPDRRELLADVLEEFRAATEAAETDERDSVDGDALEGDA